MALNHITVYITAKHFLESEKTRYFFVAHFGRFSSGVRYWYLKCEQRSSKDHMRGVIKIFQQFFINRHSAIKITWKQQAVFLLHI